MPNTLCAWAVHDGIREAQFSALWGWPTVSDILLDDYKRYGLSLYSESSRPWLRVVLWPTPTEERSV